MKNFSLWILTTLLFLNACLFLNPQHQATPTAESISTIPVPPLANFKAGLNPQYHSVLDDMTQASIYSIDFVITDDLYHIFGKQSVQYTNTEDVDLDEIQFRLFSNVLGGKATVNEVLVDGKTVKPNYSLKNSVLIVPFENPLKMKERVVIEIEFEITIPESVDLNYGVQAYYNNVLALAHAYPMIAVYDDEGWNAEIPPQAGDVTYADMSFFIVTVDAPKDLVLVGSGRVTDVEKNGDRQKVRYEAGPVRDFYLAGSVDYQEFVREVDGVTLRFYTEKENEAGAEVALDFAEQAIEVFGSRYAPYPYTELDFVSTPTLALGIEYPGMIAITDWILNPDGGYLEATVTHEVAHQWFYNLVGNDQLDEPWLDESLSQFATLQYFSDTYGEEGFLAMRQELTSRWAFTGNADIAVGLPVREYSDGEYSGIVYGRGALFFLALEEEMGTEHFDAFMKNYVMRNAWKVSTSEMLKEIAEEECVCDLTDLFETWIYK